MSVTKSLPTATRGDKSCTRAVCGLFSSRKTLTQTLKSELVRAASSLDRSRRISEGVAALLLRVSSVKGKWAPAMASAPRRASARRRSFEGSVWSGRWAAEKERRGDMEDVDVELRVEDGEIELRGGGREWGVRGCEGGREGVKEMEESDG